MPKSVHRIALGTSRDVPFDKRVPAWSNVRHVNAGDGIEQSAEDIVRRTLQQSLTVRAVGDDGAETGIYEVPAGGRFHAPSQPTTCRASLVDSRPGGGIPDAQHDAVVERFDRKIS